MKRTIRIKQELPYKPEQVWLTLIDSKLLGKWFMENDIKPLVNHEFTFQMAPQKGWDGITYCKVIEVEPEKYISYTYQGEASREKTLSCAGIHSDIADKATKGIFTKLNIVLSFKIIPNSGGTILELEHSGFTGLKLVIVSFVMGMGWKKQVGKKLPNLLEKMEKETSVSGK